MQDILCIWHKNSDQALTLFTLVKTDMPYVCAHNNGIHTGVLLSFVIEV